MSDISRENNLHHLPPWVAGALLMNSNVNEETVANLALHENHIVRRLAAEHELCSVEAAVEEALLRDRMG